MGLMDYTAVELGKKIKAGEVSVLEAANAAMDAIDALEDKFNCYVTVQERAAVQAKAEELQKKIDDGTLTGPSCRCTSCSQRQYVYKRDSYNL